MAFPIPSHLPRQQDVSSKILSKIDEATGQTLNASLASSWLVELDETIELTKKRIHDRIHADLPTFERQLLSSKSIQQRLQSLTSNVDNLNETLSNPESGLVLTLVKVLTTHATLAQQSTNATITHDALLHLQRCRSEFNSLTSLVQVGRLPEAVEASEGLNGLLDEAPMPLNQADVIYDMKRKFRALKDRTEEQLSDAYTQSIIVTASKIKIRSSVQIRKSDTILELSSILSSLSPGSLSSHFTALRRDLTTHYIEHILSQPCSTTVSPSSSCDHQLSQSPSSPKSEDRTTRLENMCTILTFLQTHLFAVLPPSQKEAFPKSICKPLSTAILNRLLVPSLPSSLSLLPAFLELVKRATEFEDTYIVGILGNAAHDREIKAWADGVSGHYERKRRMEILESARVVIVSAEDGGTFMAEVAKPAAGVAEPEVIPVQGGESVQEDSDSSWGLDQGSKEETDENGWGFDDEEEPEPEVEPEPTAEHNDDPAELWGWNDEETSPVDDDPWAEELGEPTRPAAAPSTPASRLEKSSAKGKGPHTNGTSSTKLTDTRPRQITTKAPPKETYLVSGRSKNLIRLVEDTLQESRKFASSQLFSSSTSPPGMLILCSALSIFDLYRALYPVIFGAHFALSSELALRFSNDCLYLSEEIRKMESVVLGDSSLKQNFEDSKESLKVLGDSWFEDSIDNQRQSIDQILTATAGFTDTGEQVQYDICESAIIRVLQEIRFIAPQWKGVLSKSKYYVALGSVVDAALSRILADILALPDIPEVESHRLSELCKILNALEGLFVEDTEQPSFIVAYVPSWLKFSYLSELLEASIADISYLFEEGALVDFEVDELVKLVRALFADTNLRTTTVNKLMGGHPPPQRDR